MKNKQHPYWQKIREKYQDKIIKLRKENRHLIAEFLTGLHRIGDSCQCSTDYWEEINKEIEKWEERKEGI